MTQHPAEQNADNPPGSVIGPRPEANLSPAEGDVTAPETGSAAEAVADAGDALLALAEVDRDLAVQVARLAGAFAREMARNGRLRKALAAAVEPQRKPRSSTSSGTGRPNRRAPGVLDPFALFAERGEQGLRSTLSSLDLEQLRDIVAEHGMDRDRLTMKWKDLARVIDRIVETVAARASKGSAFRE